MKSTGSGKQKFDLNIIHTACAAQASWLLTKILKLERLIKNHLRDAKPANDIQLKKQINNSQSVLHRWACRQILVVHLTKKKCGVWINSVGTADIIVRSTQRKEAP